MVASVYYLTIDDVLLIHQQQIAEFGGVAGVGDMGLIEAALLRPQTGYYKDLIEEAAVVWESLTMNHGFVDGNKRTAITTAAMFLRQNGRQLQTTNEELEQFTFHVTNDHPDLAEIAAWFETHSRAS